MPENNEAIADLKKLDPIGPAKQGEFVKFPGSPFELYQPYPPAGDQPAAIEGLVEGVKDGESELTLRTDDSTNSRVRVLKDSITRVLGTDEKEAAAS